MSSFLIEAKTLFRRHFSVKIIWHLATALEKIRPIANIKKSRTQSNFITHEVSFKWSKSCSFYYQNSQHEFNCVCHSSIAKRSSGFRRFCLMPKTFDSMFDSTTTSPNSLRFKEILPTKKENFFIWYTELYLFIKNIAIADSFLFF